MSNNDHFSIDSLFGVRGIVAVITGGGSGLGLHIAKALDYNGAKAVYIIGRRKETLDNAAKLGSNGSIIPIQGDVTSKDSLKRIAEQVKQEQGYINVLFANSGIIGIPAAQLGLPKDRKPNVDEFVNALWKPPIEHFTNTFHVNVSGTFYTALAFLSLLDAGNHSSGPEAPKSSIIVTSSIAGFSRALAAGFPYSASKAGATHLVKVLATYFADYKIRVNAIAPGLFASEMTEGMSQMAGQGGKKVYEEGGLDKKFCPMERSGKEEEMAGTAIYMASKAGGYLNGNVVIIDGGRLGGLPATY